MVGNNVVKLPFLPHHQFGKDDFEVLLELPMVYTLYREICYPRKGMEDIPNLPFRESDTGHRLGSRHLVSSNNLRYHITLTANIMPMIV
jgi:hypothetical protein